MRGSSAFANNAVGALPGCISTAALDEAGPSSEPQNPSRCVVTCAPHPHGRIKGRNQVQVSGKSRSRARFLRSFSLVYCLQAHSHAGTWDRSFQKPSVLRGPLEQGLWEGTVFRTVQCSLLCHRILQPVRVASITAVTTAPPITNRPPSLGRAELGSTEEESWAAEGLGKSGSRSSAPSKWAGNACALSAAFLTSWSAAALLHFSSG